MFVCGCDLGHYRRGTASAKMQDHVRKCVHVYKHKGFFGFFLGHTRGWPYASVSREERGRESE